MDVHVMDQIYRMVHELHMIDVRQELVQQCEIAARCRIWVETMLFTRNWGSFFQRDVIYRVILSAMLNPVHRKCYDRLLYLTKMTCTFHLITRTTPIVFSRPHSSSILPILLL